YLKRYSDSPFLVRIEDGKPGRLLRANLLEPYADEANGDWKLLVWDAASGRPRMPKGQVGHRWGGEKGNWNLLAEDGAGGARLGPGLSFLDRHDAVAAVAFDDFTTGERRSRGVPVRHVETAEGRVAVATVLDLLMAQFGVGRGLEGDYPRSYDDQAP